MPDITRREFLKYAGAFGVTVATWSVFDLLGISIFDGSVEEPLPNSNWETTGNVVSFESGIGQGKTLAAVAMACESYLRGAKVLSNAYLTFPYEHLSLEGMGNAKNSVILIDNSWMYMDSRRPFTKELEVVLQTLACTGENNNDVYIVTPTLDFLDKRVRRQVSIRNVVVKNPKTDIFKMRSLNLENGERRSILIDGKDYYKLYDTREVIRNKIN